MKGKSGKRPEISVVMTTYNGERFLEEQLRSILDQSFEDFELIISDDASTDSTPELLRELTKGDARVRLVLNEQNSGIHRNLESTLMLAKGKFIAISDQDDIWESGKLRKLLDCIGSAEGVYSDSLLVDAQDRPLGATIMERVKAKGPINGRAGSVALLNHNYISGHGILFRRELLNSVIPFNDASMFDRQIGFAAAVRGGLVFLDEPQVRHRIHGDNNNNSSLAKEKEPGYFPNARTKLERSIRRERYIRRDEMRKDLMAKLEDAAILLRKIRGFRAFWLRVLLSGAVSRLSRYEKVFFDIPLLCILVLSQDALYYPGEKGRFRSFVKYAKGKRYYEKRSSSDKKASDQLS